MVRKVTWWLVIQPSNVPSMDHTGTAVFLENITRHVARTVHFGSSFEPDASGRYYLIGCIMQNINPKLHILAAFSPGLRQLGCIISKYRKGEYF